MSHILWSALQQQVGTQNQGGVGLCGTKARICVPHLCLVDVCTQELSSSGLPSHLKRNVSLQRPQLTQAQGKQEKRNLRGFEGFISVHIFAFLITPTFSTTHTTASREKQPPISSSSVRISLSSYLSSIRASRKLGYLSYFSLLSQQSLSNTQCHPKPLYCRRYRGRSYLVVLSL